mgnify:CR=1 FL=1
MDIVNAVVAAVAAADVVFCTDLEMHSFAQAKGWRVCEDPPGGGNMCLCHSPPQCHSSLCVSGMLLHDATRRDLAALSQTNNLQLLMERLSKLYAGPRKQVIVLADAFGDTYVMDAGKVCCSLSSDVLALVNFLVPLQLGVS